MEWYPTGKKLNSDNIYHRYLNLPFEITTPDVLKTKPEKWRHEDINPWVCNNLEKWLNTLGLHTCHTEVFYTPPNHGEIPIHCDDVTVDNRTKINITYGPANGTIRWWKSKKVQQIVGKEAGQELVGKDALPDDFSERTHHNLVALKEDCELVHEANTNKVSLVNVGQLHSTYNPDPSQGRWTLCFVPASLKLLEKTNRRHLTFEEAVEVFEPYIQGDEDGN